MEKYSSNSKFNKNKEHTEDRKKIEKVVNGTVKKKKSNMFDGFLNDEILDFKSCIISAAKAAISDLAINSIQALLYPGEPPIRSRKSNSSKVSYRSYYDKYDRYDREDKRDRYSSRNDYSYDDIILESRVEAEEVLSRLDELIEVYGMASVADLYDLVGVSGQYTDNKYGWTNISSATHTRVRDGYLLKLPRAKPI